MQKSAVMTIKEQMATRCLCANLQECKAAPVVPRPSRVVRGRLGLQADDPEACVADGGALVIDTVRWRQRNLTGRVQETPPAGGRLVRPRGGGPLRHAGRTRLSHRGSANSEPPRWTLGEGVRFHLLSPTLSREKVHHSSLRSPPHSSFAVR